MDKVIKKETLDNLIRIHKEYWDDSFDADKDPAYTNQLLDNEMELRKELAEQTFGDGRWAMPFKDLFGSLSMFKATPEQIHSLLKDLGFTIKG